MSLLIVHTRWAAGSAAHLQRLTALLAGDGALPEGCCSRELRRQGNALFGTEIWTDDDALQTQQDLADVLDVAGLGRPTHTAVFAVPDPFAWPYLRAGRHLGDAPGRLHGEQDPFLAATAPDEPPRHTPDRWQACDAEIPRQRSDPVEPANVAR
jgi:hypothetical protein